MSVVCSTEFSSQPITPRLSRPQNQKEKLGGGYLSWLAEIINLKTLKSCRTVFNFKVNLMVVPYIGKYVLQPTVLFFCEGEIEAQCPRAKVPWWGGTSLCKHLVSNWSPAERWMGWLQCVSSYMGWLSDTFPHHSLLLSFLFQVLKMDIQKR